MKQYSLIPATPELRNGAVRGIVTTMEGLSGWARG